MAPTSEVVLLGPDDRTGPLESALHRVGILTRSLAATTAMRQPGWVAGAELALFCAPPGTHGTLETECYVSGTGALHVSWDTRAAAVGPYVAPGYGPCPACLGTAPTPLHGAHPALTAWATSWAALHALAALEGTSDVVGASWLWRLGEPGLGLKTWHRRSACLVSGCRQP